MYLSNLRIWNFRKYGTKDDEIISSDNSGLEVDFKDGLNVLIGENDAGKSSIIDAIKHVLLTQSHEYLQFDEKDFYSTDQTRKEQLKIECVFKGFENEEAANFLEWIGFDEDGNYKLKVWLAAKRTDNRIIIDVRAGLDDEGATLDGNARELLRVTYLKPLRDAEAELTPGYKSRFAQILRSDDLFVKEKDEAGEEKEHVLEKYIGQANDLIEEYFTEEEIQNEDLDIPKGTKGAKHIKDTITNFLGLFFEEDKPLNPFIEIAGSDLLDILKKLSLNLEENKSGLGSLNLLFIAAELILLQREGETGLKLALIEELEAHLHPQAQLRLIDYLQKEQNGRQFIVTTHSTTLGSKINLKNLIICQNDEIYPMGSSYTDLDESDYGFLQRFLNATKANLFFAKGVIIVEGDAENLLLPTIAELINRPLHRYGVSIVNVGSKALQRYAKIFKREDGKSMDIKVAVVRDLDIQLNVDASDNVIPKDDDIDLGEEQQSKVDQLVNNFNSDDGVLKVFPSPKWTMEYDLAEGGLAAYINKAIHTAQLVKSREKSESNFIALSADDIKGQIKKAQNYLEDKRETNDSESFIAYKIYEKLDKKHASKAVTAQYLSEFLLNNPETEEDDEDYQREIKEMVNKDDQISYLRDAIYHVTKSKNS
jgi:putative ATP-dependent endonuclease of OLD family